MNGNDNEISPNTVTSNTGQGNMFRPYPVTVDTVILTVKQLRETNAIGADDISFRFMKDSLPVTAFYLTISINTSIVTGSYPSLWKHALVTPAFKSGEFDEVNNFRPISILPILSKILEKIISNQLMEHLETNYLLSNTQHGFRRNLSTETALMKVCDKIYDNIDRGKITLLTLCDLSKAFDSVSHEQLLKKLPLINVDTFWFDQYLSNRTQSVKIENVVSGKLDVSFGVPQGSILGPILFLIFVNDMSQLATTCLLVQYADDSQFVHTGTVEEIHELIRDAESTLENVKLYFDRNGLMINANKTQCIFIGSHQNIARIPENTKINFDGNVINPSIQVKNLGVHMDRHMRFDKHIDEVYKKTMGILMYLNRIKDRLNTNMRISVVQTLGLSLINYCIKIYGTANQTQIHRVQKLQNFAAKIAVGKVRKYDHATPHINTLKWLKIEQKYMYDIGLFIFKILNNQVPSWVLPLATIGTTSLIQTRQQHNLIIPRTSTLTGERNLAVRGPTLWNDLPISVREASNVNAFKNKVKNHYFNRQQ